MILFNDHNLVFANIGCLEFVAVEGLQELCFLLIKQYGWIVFTELGVTYVSVPPSLLTGLVFLLSSTSLTIFSSLLV